jgi:uncharacterized protein YecE (DUF72 family)
MAHAAANSDPCAEASGHDCAAGAHTLPMPAAIRVGIAGWSVPAPYRAVEPAGSQLQRYATHFDCVEINSSFYKPHRLTTYARWADSVPPDFRFSAKLPKLITHERGLVACEEAVARFCATVAGLRDKLHVLLVQLPPGLVFDQRAAGAILSLLRDSSSATIVCEARHASWFTPEVDRLFSALGITRVLADPPIDAVPQPSITAGQFSYVRLHGQPRRYYSSYSPEYLADLAARLKSAADGLGAWCIFDNTASTAAWPNAIELKQHLLRPA